jgi:hypothetical protein
LKEEENVLVYKDKLIIIKWKFIKNICHMGTTHEDQMVLTRAQNEDIMKNKSSSYIYSGCLQREGNRYNNIISHTVTKPYETLSISQPQLHEAVIVVCV